MPSDLAAGFALTVTIAVTAEVTPGTPPTGERNLLRVSETYPTPTVVDGQPT